MARSEVKVKNQDAGAGGNPQESVDQITPTGRPAPASAACDRPRRLLARAIRCPAASRSEGVILYRSGPVARR